METPPPRQRADRLNFRDAHFVMSAARVEQAPPDEGAEVAFAGRSNAGKSSAINALTEQRKLARTSRTPGRTQLINFFALSDWQRLVDLPGYGYAKVPIAVKDAWNRELARYLETRRSLRGLVLLMDVRHPLQDFDRNAIAWAQAVNLPVHAVLTKADKLKRGPARSTELRVQKELGSRASVQLLSAQDGTGVEALRKHITSWLQLDNAEGTLSA
jgi:GTP-binding protein